LLVWQGAPSCRNLVTPCISIQGNNFSLSTDIYIWLFMVVLGGRKKKEPLPFLPLKQPHTITLGECFTLVTTYFCFYRLIVDALLTFIDLGFTSWNVDSSLNMTFSQSVSVQAQCFLQKALRFLTIFSVRSGFLAAQRDGIPSLFWQTVWIVLTDTFDQPCPSSALWRF
jgi:hypothetical protein